ncbi:hypothetical protein BCR34DRAFT_544959 [Clohesyomyces aquaticus]|uniref:Gfd2/YDR514C-like C-terminal domain-containing protein n=1 Tax=Clohesyomyces aquaticus TaxID=1231657 RepID=A0A1Y1Z0E2_9PLEO|nr:hypothetical protein BCR34DRAFT_544959 [Clohesyomyces aquaticus]
MATHTRELGELIAQLTTFLSHHSESTVMRHFLGMPLPEAPSLLNHAILVGIDTEWWEKDPKPTTEIGIVELDASYLQRQAPGVHAENILTKMRVSHARVIPYAHLVNRFKGHGDPEQFDFGQTVFATPTELQMMLIQKFSGRLGQYGNSLRPVIFVGHAVKNDFEKLQESFGINLPNIGSIIKVIDTQSLAKEARIHGTRGPNISLKELVEFFNIKPVNLHSAGNDVAYTMMMAILAPIKNKLYPAATTAFRGKPPALVKGRHIQATVDNVMRIRKFTPTPTWGRRLFCIRCDMDSHVRPDCYSYVTCQICIAHQDPMVRKYAWTHKTNKCIRQETSGESG